MKKLLILILFISAIASAQKPVQFLGTRENEVKVRGAIVPDSSLGLPADTLYTARIGSLAHKGDTIFYKSHTGFWKQLAADSGVFVTYHYLDSINSIPHYIITWGGGIYTNGTGDTLFNRIVSGTDTGSVTPTQFIYWNLKQAALGTSTGGKYLYQDQTWKVIPYTDISGLATVAHTGDYNDLSNETWTNSGSNVINNNVDNVGVGMGSPTAKLHIDQTSGYALKITRTGDRRFDVHSDGTVYSNSIDDASSIPKMVNATNGVLGLGYAAIGNIKILPDANYTVQSNDYVLILLEPATPNNTLTLPAASTLKAKDLIIDCRVTTTGHWLLSGSFVQSGTTGSSLTENFVNSGFVSGRIYHLVSALKQDGSGWIWVDINN